jgi:hypothetical protein
LRFFSKFCLFLEAMLDFLSPNYYKSAVLSSILHVSNIAMPCYFLKKKEISF